VSALFKAEGIVKPSASASCRRRVAQLETGNGYVLIGPNAAQDDVAAGARGAGLAQEGKLVYRARETAAAGPYPDPGAARSYAHQQPYLSGQPCGHVEYGLARRGMARERRAALQPRPSPGPGLPRATACRRTAFPAARSTDGAARAKVLDPVLLLLDEPTANLDGEARAQVLELVRADTESHTVLIATHDPEIIRLASSRACGQRAAHRVAE